ncbi:MAG: hypothetical protein Aurels2KO_37260 [Aureliella sp.]
MLDLASYVREFAYRNPEYSGIYQNPNQTVCYAYCEVESPDVARQLLLGMDDGARAWLDGKLVLSDAKPDWLSLFEHAIQVPRTDQPIGLLIEMHNFTGGFAMACYGGFRFERRLIYSDTLEPVADEIVRIQIPGEPEQLAKTGPDGSVKVRALPFHIESKFDCLGTTFEENPEDLFLELNQNVSPEPVHIARATSGEMRYQTLDAPPGQYVDVVETVERQILLANATDGTIYIYNGGRVYPHPDLQDFTTSSITCMAVGPEGSVWIGTQSDGVFHYRDGSIRRLSGRGPTGGPKRNGDSISNSAIGAICPLSDEIALFSTIIDMGETEQSKLFSITALGDVTNLPLPDEAEIGDMSLHRYAPGVRLTDNPGISRVKTAPYLTSLLRDVEVVLYRQVTRPLVLCEDGIFSIEPGNLRISSMAKSGSKFWFAGQSFFSLDAEGKWNRIRWPGNPMYKRMEVFNSDSLGLLAVCPDVIYSFKDEKVRKLDVPIITESRRRSCIASDGRLIIASGNSGVLIVDSDRIQSTDHRGFLSGRAGRISAFADGVTISSREHDVGVVRDGILTRRPIGKADDGKDIGYALSPYVSIEHITKDTTIATTTLVQGSGQRINTTLPLYLKTGDYTWKALHCDTWEGPATAYFFVTKLLDERIIVGSSQGLAELKHEKLEHLEIESRSTEEGVVAIMDTPDGVLWMVSGKGNLIRYPPGQKSDSYSIPLLDGPASNVLCHFEDQVYIGTEQGLFVFDESAGVVPALKNKFRAQAIVDLRTDLGDNNLWVITRNAGVQVVAPNGAVCPIRPFDTERSLTINGCEVDADGRLWLATTTGTLSFEPSTLPPNLALDKTSGEILNSATNEFRVACKESVRLRFATMDDSHLCTVRYREDGGEWLYAERAGNLHSIALRYETSGSRRIEVQALDGEWNESPSKHFKITSFYPFYQHPGVRYLALATTGGLAVGIFITLHRLRRSRLREAGTREKLYEEEQRARQLAEQTSREREMLLARVCHDLRNPLGVVLVAADLYSAAQGADENIIKLLRGGTDSMRYLTDQLLNYAKLRRRPELTNSPCDLADFAERLHASSVPRLKDSKVDFSTSISAKLPSALSFDRDMLAEVLTNLIDNAAKHTTRGSISVHLSVRDEHRWQAEVRDTGTGIDESVLKTVFKPFYRGELGKSVDEKGVGLGLFIARELVDLMNGQIEMASRVGQGTIVTVCLPMVGATEQLPARPAKAMVAN